MVVDHPENNLRTAALSAWWAMGHPCRQSGVNVFNFSKRLQVVGGSSTTTATRTADEVWLVSIHNSRGVAVSISWLVQPTHLPAHSRSRLSSSRARRLLQMSARFRCSLLSRQSSRRNTLNRNRILCRWTPTYYSQSPNTLSIFIHTPVSLYNLESIRLGR